MLIEQNYNIGLYIYLFLGCLFFILYKHQKSKQNNSKKQSFSPLTSSKDSVWVENYVTNPEKIINHKFTPLLHRVITQRKFRPDESAAKMLVARGFV